MLLCLARAWEQPGLARASTLAFFFSVVHYKISRPHTSVPSSGVTLPPAPQALVPHSLHLLLVLADQHPKFDYVGVPPPRTPTPSYDWKYTVPVVLRVISNTKLDIACFTLYTVLLYTVLSFPALYSCCWSVWLCTFIAWFHYMVTSTRNLTSLNLLKVTPLYNVS
jgi:hypothetical protein